MAYVIAPEQWQKGIADNRLLPNRCTQGLFTGSGVNIANNVDGPNSACRVWDIMVSDYITDYDDRRLNGLAGTNAAGHDGWGASAYGVFQDVHFDSRVYTMGRHRSVAMRVFAEAQYSGAIGEWGTATESNISSNGQAMMKTAALLSEAKDLWQKEVLGPDIDKYVLFAVLNGHMAGRWVPNAQYVDRVMDGDASHGQWVAQPGPVVGQAIEPQFAPIHCIQWEENNLAQMLQTIKVAWNTLQIPQDSRVICIDPAYELQLMMALIGSAAAAGTDGAYNDLRDGKFTRLMGWDFDFSIPSNYWPKLYVDDNLNVIHSATGMAADQKMISASGTGNSALLTSLIAAHRQGAENFIRTEWDGTKFVKKVTNYPMGMVAAAPFYGKGVVMKTFNAGENAEYPWDGRGAGFGYGVSSAEATLGPKLAGAAQLVQVIGAAIYRKAAQQSQEYSSMVTDEGRTRGKFTEMAMDIKYDAWVIESLSHGIIPIIDDATNMAAVGVPLPSEVWPKTADLASPAPALVG